MALLSSVLGAVWGWPRVHSLPGLGLTLFPNAPGAQEPGERSSGEPGAENWNAQSHLQWHSPRALPPAGTGGTGGPSVRAKASIPQVWNQLQPPHPGQRPLSCSAAGMSTAESGPLCHPS